MASHGTRAKAFNDWLHDAFATMDEYTSTGRRRSQQQKTQSVQTKKKLSAAELLEKARKEKAVPKKVLR